MILEKRKKKVVMLDISGQNKNDFLISAKQNVTLTGGQGISE